MKWEMKLMDVSMLLESLLASERLSRINKWLLSDPYNKKQFVPINGFNSYLVVVKCGLPQGCLLGPLLFLININYLHLAIKYSEVHNFADDTNLLNFNSSVNSINKQVNHDLKTYQIGWRQKNTFSTGKT